MIDETGKIIWEETFDLWGKPHDHLETRVVGGAILTNVKPREANKNQAISQPFRFPGQYHDEETGLYYNRYRYYMPGEGMYTQRDPIGLAGGNPTTYGYVFNTLKHIDPFGLNVCSVQTLKNATKNNHVISATQKKAISNNISNPKLKNLFEQMYRNDAKIPDGGTASSILYTKLTGNLVGGSDHIIKGQEFLTALKNLLKGAGKYKNEVLSNSDRSLASYLVDTLKNALNH